MSNLFIPLTVIFIIIYGVYKKIDVYDAFIEGTRESFPIVKSMFPPLISMILAVNIFTKSGILDFILYPVKPILKILKIPSEIIPVALMRPLSGSFGLAVLNDIYKTHGPDSFIGILSSVLQGSSDTTVYIITLYFGVIGIKKIKNALWLGLIADLIMIILSLIIVPVLT